MGVNTAGICGGNGELSPEAMPVTMAEFTAMAEEIWAGMPPPLLRHLPGGLVIAEQAKTYPDRRDLVILGEYQVDLAGRRVVLYHGSFQHILGRQPAEDWRAQIQATIRHELRHHLESLAGRADLEREDWESLRAYGWPGH